MQPYQHDYLITDAHVDCFGRLKPSMLLFFCQDVAGHHCLQLGTDYDTLAQKNLFWAIVRQKVQITRLPMSGESIHVKTWPMPTTRTCFPRSTVAYDRHGQELFRSIGLWVLMDCTSRAMILPGKSGVTVQGLLTGNELMTPGPLARKDFGNIRTRRVGYCDLDRNSHMNNTSVYYGGVRWTYALKTGQYDRYPTHQGGLTIELDGGEFALKQVFAN